MIYFSFFQKTFGAKYCRNFFMVVIPSSGSMFLYIDTASAVKSFAFGGRVPIFFRRAMTCCGFLYSLEIRSRGDVVYSLGMWR